MSVWLTRKDPRECGTPSLHTAHSSCPVVLSPSGPAPARWVQGPPQRSPWSLPIPVWIIIHGIKWDTSSMRIFGAFLFNGMSNLRTKFSQACYSSARIPVSHFTQWTKMIRFCLWKILKSFSQVKATIQKNKTWNLTSISLSSMSVGWPWKQYSLVPAAFKFLSRSCRHSNRNRKRL